MSRLAIMGAGSLGTVLGAYLSKYVDIDLIDANAEHVKALNTGGATVIGTAQFNTPVRALTPDEMTGTYDLVFYIVKQLYNKAALAALEPHLGKDSVVCTLQNGYPEPELTARLGKERVLGCTVGWGATWIGPGVSMLTSNPEHMNFTVGRPDGGIGEKLLAAQSILSLMCPAHITGNLIEARWAKLLTNASFSGLSAVLGCTFGELLDNPEAFLYLQRLMNEIIAVSAADGATMLPGVTVDLRAALQFDSEEERIAKSSVYEHFWGPHRKLKASMLQDIENGRPCEIDAICGVVSERGSAHSVMTPYTDAVIEIVRQIERGESKSSLGNLKRLQGFVSGLTE